MCKCPGKDWKSFVREKQRVIIIVRSIIGLHRPRSATVGGATRQKLRNYVHGRSCQREDGRQECWRWSPDSGMPYREQGLVLHAFFFISYVWSRKLREWKPTTLVCDDNNILRFSSMLYLSWHLCFLTNFLFVVDHCLFTVTCTVKILLTVVSNGAVAYAKRQFLYSICQCFQNRKTYW